MVEFGGGGVDSFGHVLVLMVVLCLWLSVAVVVDVVV